MNLNSIQKQRGIALLAVLAVSVTFSILIGAATVMIQRQHAIGSTAKQQFFVRAASHKKQQELIYLIATQRVTRAGISQGLNKDGQARVDGLFKDSFAHDEIRVDGNEYTAAINGVSISYSIQATSGLIPVNTSDPLWLRLWLQGYGVNNMEIRRLTDYLADYADEDQWARAAGREYYGIGDSQKHLPTNFLLQHCSELSKVWGWKTAIAKWGIKREECSLSRQPTININAMPRQLLKILFSKDGEALFDGRNENDWLYTPDDLHTRIAKSMKIKTEYISVSGSNSYIINVGDSSHYNTSVKIRRAKSKPFEIYF